MTRQCGDCQLCCKVMPIKDIDKPALKKCKHQKFNKGCAIYQQRPKSCRLWECAWLSGKLPSNCRRPDKVGYVVDIILDSVTGDDNGVPFKVSCVQIWIDPSRFPDKSIRLENSILDWLLEIDKGAIIRAGSVSGAALIYRNGDWVFSEGTFVAETDGIEGLL